VTDTPHAAHGEEHGHGDHSPWIQHHYDDAQHQFDSGKLGVWLFLAQEVLFFSALFVAYILYRHHHPELYSYAHKYLDVKYGAINTAVLIFSSLTAAWGVRCAQKNQKRGLILCIVMTLMCALAFLGIKYIEYSHKVHEHILFGSKFDPCVSSGEVPLLTKNNHCPGHKSSVVWNYGTQRPYTGCTPELAIDQDPRKDGLQVDCTVSEVKVEKEAKPDATGAPVWKDLSARPIANKCPDPFEEALEHAEGHPEKPHSYPCWREAAQPQVCRVAWYYGARTGDQLKPSPAYTSNAECSEALGKAKKAAKEAGQTPEWVECQRANAVGFIVEYGDHGHRGDDIQIRADCKAPPKIAPPADPLADKEQQLAFGHRSANPELRYNTHQLHALEAAGPPPEHTGMFFTIYFAMTGLHGIHVLAGVVLFIWLLVRSIRGHFTPEYFGPIDFAALYWHIVDLIWIFLFPLLYLIH
jgi:cytochrome c oxidase subunit III